MNRKGRRAAASRSDDQTGLVPGRAGLFAQAIGHHQAGRLEDAIAAYRQALALNPTHVEALNNLGAALADLKRWDEATASYRRALELKPKLPEIQNNLAVALREQGHLDEAIALYREAVALKPSYAEAHTNLGVALADLKQWEEAATCYRQALRLSPRFAPAHNNLGVVLQEQGQLDRAVAAYRQAIDCNPRYAEAYMNLGVVGARLNDWEQAISLYQWALQLNPKLVDAHRNLGALFSDLRRHADAVAVLRRALALAPNNTDVHITLGSALYVAGQTSEAIAMYDRALALRPDKTEALFRRGSIMLDLGRFEEATQDFARLIARDPDYPNARGCLQYARMRCCDWTNRDEELAQIAAGTAAGKPLSPPFMFMMMVDNSALQQKSAQIFHQYLNPVARPPMTHRVAQTGSKLRIAYLSANFHHHPTSHLMKELWQTHDKTRFETAAISFGPQDEVTELLKPVFDSFIDVRNRSDADVAASLRERGIDIAVDLMGYTLNSRSGILTWRPAPLQVSFLGYPGTMGAEHIDYIIADRWVVPDNNRAFFDEKIVHMPDAYQPTDTGRDTGPAPSREAAGLPAQGFVFCCFNNNFKITPTIFEIWMRLLDRVDGSVLWLLEDNAAAANNLRREASARGVAPSRLVFAPRVTPSEHLARHRLADLFLDTLPYNAHTTASDALWMGLPLITCAGASFPARVAASLLAAAGLPELITQTLADYEALALHLAAEPAKLASCKAKLAQNRSTFPLFNTDRFRRHLESAYETMWARHQHGEPPESFAVAPIDS